MLKKDEVKFTKRCLSKLGLTEKKGLDGQVMLYPLKAKEKKMERHQLDSLVTRLYKVKEKESDLINVRI